MSNVQWINQITAYDVDKLEEFKLILNANEIISIAEDTFEIFDEETGNWVEHKGCKIYVRDCCYKVLNSYEEFFKIFGR
ncbi:hypothetical protein [Streptococcus gallolyticus]|uniref:hypothetical protein n=1 Tax=Streptococcus gallolyticus TaxID=315405 RepID=UPI002284EFC9|nr:hypothetical protein [Streptococcus gallolyticus]MCY7156251.1 hypothetical protein [Streptococcus gallolyticus subsp. gallolyticus]